MEDIKINLNKDLNDMNESLTLELKNINYLCLECSSLIEITQIDEEFIEFKCNNNHYIKMNIKDYLDKIKENKNKMALSDCLILNNSICNKHKKEYLSYCFECNMHLCKKCLITGEHSYHYKINIIEIIPNNKVLKKIENLIDSNDKKRKDLIQNKKDIENKINEILNKNVNKIKDIKYQNKKRITIMKKKK